MPPLTRSATPQEFGASKLLVREPITAPVQISLAVDDDLKPHRARVSLEGDDYDISPYVREAVLLIGYRLMPPDLSRISFPCHATAGTRTLYRPSRVYTVITVHVPPHFPYAIDRWNKVVKG